MISMGLTGRKPVPIEAGSPFSTGSFCKEINVERTFAQQESIKEIVVKAAADEAAD